MTTILGIDPGLTRLGVGVVRQGGGRTVSLLHVEVLRTPATSEISIDWAPCRGQLMNYSLVSLQISSLWRGFLPSTMCAR